MINLGIKDTYKKGSRPEEWPVLLTLTERLAVLDAASKAGKDAHIAVAAMLYMGLRPLEVVKMAIYSAMGNAIKTDAGYLTVPLEFKRVLINYFGEIEYCYFDKITRFKEDEAAEAAIKAFKTAGLDTAGAWLRLRRTAAMLHHVNYWTKDKYIEIYFNEIKLLRGALKGVYYNPDMIDLYNKGLITSDGDYMIESPFKDVPF